MVQAGRSDGKVLAAWLSTVENNHTRPEWRLVSFPGHAAGAAAELKTGNASLHYHTTRLASVRADTRSASYLVTLDMAINVTATRLSRVASPTVKPVYLAGHDTMQFYALQDSATSFAPQSRPMPVARESLDTTGAKVKTKAKQHAFAYDPKHERVIVASVVEQYNSASPSKVTRNLRVDTTDIRPDPAIHTIAVNTSSGTVDVSVANHGLQPTAGAGGKVQLYFGDIAGAVTKHLIDFAVPALVSSQTAAFRFAIPPADLAANRGFGRVWAKFTGPDRETTLSNNMQDTYPNFDDSILMDAVTWRANTTNTTGTGRAEVTVSASVAIKGGGQIVTGQLYVAAFALHKTMDAAGVVHSIEWRMVAATTANTVSGRGATFLTLGPVPEDDLQAGEMLVAVFERPLPASTTTLDVAGLFGKLPHKRVHTFSVPAEPDLYTNNLGLMVRPSPNPGVAAVTVTVGNLGLRAARGATVEVWMPGTGAAVGVNQSAVARARTGLLLHTAVVNVSGRSTTSFVFETDGLQPGHNNVVVLLNPDETVRSTYVIRPCCR